MNLNFLCCIGAEQKHDQSGLLKMNQIYFYRAYADETMSEILEDNFFNHSESHLKENDIILAYSPNEQDLPKVRWLRIVIPHAGLVKTEQVDNSYLLEVLRNDLGDLGDQVAEIEGKIPSDASSTNQMATKSDITNKITNCITEIPQDIKLELVDGAVVLKAGSKVYVPNGAGVFDVVDILNDVRYTYNGTEQLILLVSNTGNQLIVSGKGLTVSGATDSLSGTAYHTWYDTTNNVINRYNASASEPAYLCSFPIAVITVSNGVVTSIDQVFNGFGYIGGTIFALPGIKGLVPNGRNADGTLNSINVFNATTVKINTPSDGERDICLSRYSGYTDVPYVGTYIYDAEDNFVKRSSDGLVGGYVLAGKFTKTGGQITDFYVRPAFHAVDYSDTKFIAHQAMPSDRYVGLTISSSNTNFIAPADGYFQLFADATSVGQYVQVTSGATYYSDNSPTTNNTLSVTVPVSKGKNINCVYTTPTALAKFIYANGAK